MSSHTGWMQFYHHNFSADHESQTTPATIFNDRVSEATVVTTTLTSPTAPTPPGSSSHLNPEGRVSKPVRRRSRASRRTPTTLLNTDTTNFRAMVQQFTGGPRVPFVPGGSQYSIPRGTNFNFELGNRQQIVIPTATMVPSAYHHLQFQQQQQQNQQHQNYMFSVNGSESGDAFVQRVNNSRRSRLDMEVPDGPRASSSNENQNTNNYML
ncbi:unnamed protein product [Ilex paraguariensis]|uniref:VQ domain-containing protein n=1 Tax=Ilex paraguariensis TaxID=185542 RepID=A0ABC8U5X5_9AQUA